MLQLQGTDASGVAQIVTITLSAVQGPSPHMSVMAQALVGNSR
ncbi:MAG TPA: hypothetical protein VLS46_03055 [Gaiellaceae bacterium]|nr:hypothetical protein [Gaiellaceae bacterium]